MNKFITDYLGAYHFLRLHFKEEDLCYELVEQVLAQKWFEETDLWEMN